MVKGSRIAVLVAVLTFEVFGYSSPYPLKVWGPGLTGGTYDQFALYADATYDVLFEAPYLNYPTGRKCSYHFSWRGLGVSGSALSIMGNGNIGIGTTDPGNYKLAVEGKVGAREIIVTTSPWADHVFNDEYNLKPLNEVESFIKEQKHLEGMPTAKDVEKNGANVGEVQAKLLEKIEELTLYMIEIKKENESMHSRIVELEKSR